jgi:N-acetyltransferase
MAPQVKKTYASRPRPALPSSPPSLLSSPPVASNKRKRPLVDHFSVINTSAPPPKKRAKSTHKSEKPKQTNFTQLHFCLDTSILRTCPLCDLSYTKGAPDDESLHRTHCARVQRGMEWGREEEKDKDKAEVTEVAVGVRLKDAKRGRILSVRADATGKIGSKVRWIGS